MKIKLKIKAKTVEVFYQSGGIISTIGKVSPPKDLQFKLNFAIVEVVEMVEMFSDCVWEGYNYEKTSKLAFVDGTKNWESYYCYCCY